MTTPKFEQVKKLVKENEEQLRLSRVITRLCPNCNHPNTKKESLIKYVCRYCESEEDTNW